MLTGTSPNCDVESTRSSAGIFRRFVAGWAWTFFAGAVFASVVALWWNSSRWSERHIFPLAGRSVEVFSASSLLRLSFANGVIGGGRQSGYRHRNARGRMDFEPLVPRFRAGHGLFEITLGYWHLALISSGVLMAAGWVDFLRRRKSGREGSHWSDLNRRPIHYE